MERLKPDQMLLAVCLVELNSSALPSYEIYSLADQLTQAILRRFEVALRNKMLTAGAANA